MMLEVVWLRSEAGREEGVLYWCLKWDSGMVERRQILSIFFNCISTCLACKQQRGLEVSIMQSVLEVLFRLDDWSGIRFLCHEFLCLDGFNQLNMTISTWSSLGILFSDCWILWRAKFCSRSIVQPVVNEYCLFFLFIKRSCYCSTLNMNIALFFYEGQGSWVSLSISKPSRLCSLSYLYVTRDNTSVLCIVSESLFGDENNATEAVR